MFLLAAFAIFYQNGLDLLRSRLCQKHIRHTVRGGSQLLLLSVAITVATCNELKLPFRRHLPGMRYRARGYELARVGA